MKFDFKKLLPHAIAIVAFLLVSVFYCKPALDGKVVSQSDMIQWKGMSKDAENYRERHGVYPQWTNSMFSGMPTFAIAFNNNAAIAGLVPYITGFMLPVPILYFFLGCLCFYFLSQVLRVNPYIGMLGAFAFAFSSYDPIIISAGHHTKLMTIVQMPALLGAIILTYQRKYWLGGALTAWFTAGLISHTHMQMIYYFLIVALFMTVSYIIYWISTKQVKHLLIAGIITTAAAVAGVLTNMVTLRPISEYSKYTIRGSSALASPATGKDNSNNAEGGGVGTTYAFAYSYDIPETFTLMVPNVYGGASDYIGNRPDLLTSDIAESLDQKEQGEIQSSRVYWGDQTSTSGPVYLGAVICFLFVLGMVTIKSNFKWWILVVCIFAIILSWGKHLLGVNSWLFDHLPLYNKFRAPTQSLIIPQLTFPIIAVLGLQELLFGKKDDKLRWKQLLTSGYITGGLLVILALIGLFTNFKSITDSPITGKVFAKVVQIRSSLFWKDFLRSLVFIGLSFTVLLLVAKSKLARYWGIAILLVLSTFDLLQIDRRYLNDDNFKTREETEVEGFLTTPDESGRSNAALVDLYKSIQQDQDPHYRVYLALGNEYNDAFTSYYLRSIGGYHPAKLRIYQDLIENQLATKNQQVLNMLDVKYTLGVNSLDTNHNALGAAWFVKGVRFVDNARQEMDALNNLDVKDSAVIIKQFQSQVVTPTQFDSAASIKLTKYDNDEIEYSIQAATSQLAILSEVYYPAGWKAFVDGKETPIIRANYVLRAVNIPANAKKLELKFEPEVYTSSYRITGIMNYLLIVLLLLGLFMGWRDWRKQHRKVIK